LLLPNRPDEVTLEWSYCVPRSTFELPAFEDRLTLVVEGIEIFNREDFHVNALVQQGYGSRLAVRGPYAAQESILIQLNRWLVKRYRQQAERARGGLY
jgi:hypothetical protein